MNRPTRRRGGGGFLSRFRDNYYRPAIRGIAKYIKPISDLGGSVGEGVYALKSFLPYRYQNSADLAAKALLGTQRVVDVGLDVARAPSYTSAIEASKRAIPAIQVGRDLYGAGKDLYGEYKHNSLIRQARANYNPNSDRLVVPPRGSRSFEFMRTLGTNDGMSNRAD